MYLWTQRFVCILVVLWIEVCAPVFYAHRLFFFFCFIMQYVEIPFPTFRYILF